MKLIEIQSLEKTNTTIYKTTPIKNVINGITYEDQMKTSIPEKVITRYKIYYLPIDKITKLLNNQIDGRFYINDIEVNEETFKKIKKILESEV